MRFTLITEGVSENRIIKKILVSFFNDTDLFFRDAQPQIESGKQKTAGGWNEVLKYCQRTDDLVEIFNNTDFLVIQIDTDQSQMHPFGVNHTKADNTDKSIMELYDDVVDRLRSLFDERVSQEFGERILFAICVHSIECWLLPLYYSNNHRNDTKNCLRTLNVELRRKNIAALPLKDKNNAKSVRIYDGILKNWRRKQDVKDSAQYNYAFEKFIDSLDAILINRVSM